MANSTQNILNGLCGKNIAPKKANDIALPLELPAIHSEPEMDLSELLKSCMTRNDKWDHTPQS